MQALDTYRGETDTKGNNKKTEEQTWICTVQSLFFQSHDGRHAISTLQLIHLRLTHFQCSQYHELQSMLQIPSRLPREYESPSPDHRTRYTVVVNTVLGYSNVLHLHQRVCHKVGDPMVRTSRFTFPIPQQVKLRQHLAREGPIKSDCSSVRTVSSAPSAGMCNLVSSHRGVSARGTHRSCRVWFASDTSTNQAAPEPCA